ncbi:MAG: L-serine ammonia-lyase, iron-sulfur-dependent, subunit alpha [Eubacteriales bacterium]|nr:L-serine ammonia-lyase, iron-sulfur-dependent, subunit alpha [Eubacteriales bacterium]
MKSIRDIYKIGKGPSSSHTMGPERAALLFLKRYPDADRFQVTLYGSLSKTGVGHGTDRVLRNTLGEIRTEVIFSQEILPGMHPNTMDFSAFQGGQEIGRLRVESIGGGDIRIPSEPEPAEQEEVYIEHSFAEIADFCKWRYIDTLSEYVELNEGEEVWDFLGTVWQTMKQAIAEGLSRDGILPGGLNVQRKAKYLFTQIPDDKIPALKEFQRIAAYAYAVAEQNADNGTVVTAPTCGACGVLPAVLKYAQDTKGFTDEEICRALATAGVIGNLTKTNASISGAECGCQAEIGTACSMAAAALAELYGQNLDQVEYAAEVAMEHHLGLTCDPICGLVQIPCIERNAVAAVRAMNACNLSYFLTGSRNISYDMVCRAMKETGIHLDHRFRETSEGGLAKLYQRRQSKETLNKSPSAEQQTF